MSLDWKLQRHLSNRPHSLMLFLAISLLLHGGVFLGVETYWRKSVNHSLQTHLDSPIPVEYIEVPADKAVTPPLDAKQKASTNSKAGGDAHPKRPIATGAFETKPTAPLPSSQPSLTQSKSSTSQPSQPSVPSQQPQTAPRQDPLPLRDSKPNISSPVAPMPKPASSSRQPPQQNPSPPGNPANLASREFVDDSRNIPSTPKPSQPSVSPQQPQPATRRDPLPLRGDKPNISPPVAPMPKPESGSSQPPRQNASPPGNPVNLASRDLKGDGRNIPSTPQPSQPSKPPQQSQSVTRRDPLPRASGKPNISPPVAPMPKPESSSRQPPRQGASLLGGPLSLSSRDLKGDGRNIPNANRLALDLKGVDARQDVYLGPYLNTLRRQVEKQWLPEISDSSQQTILGFSVSRTGQVTNLRVLQPSGSTLIDQAALKAVQQAAPFKPLPEPYQAEQVHIHFRFNINVYGELEPSSSKKSQKSKVKNQN